jgi:hypothetical protein
MFHTTPAMAHKLTQRCLVIDGTGPAARTGSETVTLQGSCMEKVLQFIYD